MMEIQTGSAEETFEAGRRMGAAAQRGEVYALLGDLGAGKTVFAKGFAAGVGVRETVSSPTFTILQIYEDGRLPLYHFDVYRIADPEEMFEVGFEEYLSGQGVCLVEWAELVRELMPENTRTITIEKDPSKGMDYRKITLCG